MYDFVVNAGSGKNRGGKYLARITEYCDAKGIEYSVHKTEAKGHAERITRELCERSADTVVAIGGDGTFHEVLNGLDTERVRLGFIPAGRGNDFARAAKLESDPVKAFEVILAGKVRNIDYIDCGTRRCLNVAGTGMDVDVLQSVIDKKNAISYYISLVGCLLKFKPYHMRITADGETFERDCIMVGISNGVAIGGGMMCSPDAKIDDGKLDLMIAEKKDRSVLRVLPRFLSGKHEGLPELSHRDVEEVEVDNGDYPIQLDGEIYTGMRLKCKIVKGGLMTF